MKDEIENKKEDGASEVRGKKREDEGGCGVGTSTSSLYAGEILLLTEIAVSSHNSL